MVDDAYGNFVSCEILSWKTAAANEMGGNPAWMMMHLCFGVLRHLGSEISRVYRKWKSARRHAAITYWTAPAMHSLPILHHTAEEYRTLPMYFVRRVP